METDQETHVHYHEDKLVLVILGKANCIVAPEDKVYLVLGSVGEVDPVVAAVDKVDLVLGSADAVDLILLIVDKIALIIAAVDEVSSPARRAGSAPAHLR